MADRIIVQRGGALGDVILTTPIIRRLRRDYPDASINMVTGFPNVFDENPHLGQFHSTGTERLISLDMVYECQPHMHIVQAYMQEVFGDPGESEDLQQELFFSKKYAGGSAQRGWVAVHAAQAGWHNRTLPRRVWRRVIEGVHAMDMWPILVGSERDAVPDTNVSKLFGASLQMQASVIAGCVAFVGSDSAMLHVAGCTEVPIVGVFTSALPETRLPWRHGELGWRCVSVQPNISCVGCLVRRAAPVTAEHCERGDSICVESIEADIILAALQKAIDGGT